MFVYVTPSNHHRDHHCSVYFINVMKISYRSIQWCTHLFITFTVFLLCFLLISLSLHPSISPFLQIFHPSVHLSHMTSVDNLTLHRLCTHTHSSLARCSSDAELCVPCPRYTGNTHTYTCCTEVHVHDHQSCRLSTHTQMSCF